MGAHRGPSKKKATSSQENDQRQKNTETGNRKETEGGSGSERSTVEKGKSPAKLPVGELQGLLSRMGLEGPKSEEMAPETPQIREGKKARVQQTSPKIEVIASKSSNHDTLGEAFQQLDSHVDQFSDNSSNHSSRSTQARESVEEFGNAIHNSAASYVIDALVDANVAKDLADFLQKRKKMEAIKDWTSEVASSNSKAKSVLSMTSQEKVDEALKRLLAGQPAEDTLLSEEIKKKLNLSYLKPTLAESPSMEIRGLGPSPYLTRPKTLDVPMAFAQATPKTLQLSTLDPLLAIASVPVPHGLPIAKTKLEMPLPTFTGSNLLVWLEEFLDHLLLTKQTNLSDEGKVTLILQCVKSPEIKKALKGIRKKSSSFGEFLQGMEKAFPHLQTDASIKKQIEEVKSLPLWPQPHEIIKLNTELSSLFEDLTEVTEGQKIEWLLKKVSKKCRENLMELEEDECKCSTYEGIIEVLIRKANKRLRMEHMARGCGDEHHKVNFLSDQEMYELQQVLFAKGKGGKGGKGKGKGGKGNAGKGGGRGIGEKVGKFEASISCWHCGKLGHYRDQCYAKEKEEKSHQKKNEPKKDTNSNVQEKNKVNCQNCQRPGHTKAECFAKGGGKEGQWPSNERPRVIKTYGLKKEDQPQPQEKPKRGREEEPKSEEEAKKAKLLALQKLYDKKKKQAENIGKKLEAAKNC